MVQALEPGDPQVIGPYRLLGLLGSGGMGRVFLGLSVGGRRVAVKVIRAELAADPEFRIRFRQEVAAARKVSGLFTAVVVDADADAQVPWLATAYVAGPSLAEAVDKNGPLPIDAVLALAAGLAESLAAIHAAGVAHRDLKPTNVLLAQDGPRVIDFGISRAVESTSLTNAGLVIGSPGFMSPEQAEGGAAGLPSDIFSLGAVLAFAASGQRPFGSGSSPALLYRVVHGTPDLAKVPDQIRPLIERCLTKDPSARPAAADVLAQVGIDQPVTGWLPEAVIDVASEDQLAGPAASAGSPAVASVKESQSPAAGPETGRTVTARNQSPAYPFGRQSWLGRRSRLHGVRFWRVLAVASACGTLVAASVLAGFILNDGSRSPQTHSQLQATQQSPKDTSPSTSRSVTTPALPYRFKVTGASQHSCSEEGTTSSASSFTHALVTFVNDTAIDLKLIWLNFNGGQQLYATLPPGTEAQEDTYIGHDWLIANSQSACLGILQINGPGHVIVTPS